MRTRPSVTLARNVLGTLSLLGLLAACADDGPAQSSGLAAETRLNALADGDRRKLCDWRADLFGGYGKSRKCSEKLLWPGPMSQMNCVDELKMAGASCTSTVAVYEECHRSFFVADACREGAVFPPACQMLIACFSGS